MMPRPLTLAAALAALISTAQAQSPGQVGIEGSQIYFAAGTPLDADGRAVVRYGAFKALGGPADAFVLGRAKPGDMCSNAAFQADPYPGVGKACYVVKPVECLPSQLGGTGSRFVQSFNSLGAWAGYWCKDDQGIWNARVVAITKQYTDNVTVWKTVSAFVQNPQAKLLTFGADPFTDATLRAVWVPEVAKLDAVKPK